MNYRTILTATAQTLALFLSGFIIPFLGQVLALFTPLPLILIAVRNGWKDGLAAIAAAAAVMMIIGGWQSAAVLLLSFGLMAIGTAEGMRKNLRPEQTALLGGLLPVTIVGAVVMFFIVRTGRNPFTEVDTYLRESIASAITTYKELGLTEIAGMISSVPDSFLHSLARLLPGIMVATSVMQAACCYGIARAVIARKPGPDPLPAQPPLAAWHAPDQWVWGLIATLALIIIPQRGAQFTGWNLAILFGFLYLAQGAAIVEHYLVKARIRSFSRGLLHAIILALPTIVFVIALGIVDIWADFRKVRRPAAPLPR